MSASTRCLFSSSASSMPTLSMTVFLTRRCQHRPLLAPFFPFHLPRARASTLHTYPPASATVVCPLTMLISVVQLQRLVLMRETREQALSTVVRGRAVSSAVDNTNGWDLLAIRIGFLAHGYQSVPHSCAARSCRRATRDPYRRARGRGSRELICVSGGKG